MGRALHLPRTAPSYLSKQLHCFCIRFCHSHLENSATIDGERVSDIELCIRNSGAKRPNSYELSHLIRASTRLGWDFFTLQLHNYAVKSGFLSNVFVAAALLSFYAEINSLAYAHHLFDKIPEPNVVLWNTLISRYVKSGDHTKALDLFLLLDRSETPVDGHSITAALAASGRLNLLQLGRSVHCKIIKIGIEYCTFVSNCLIDMYGKCGLVEEAITVFDEMVDKDSISWNSVIAANARNRRVEHAFGFLHRMPSPDTISYNEVINGVALFGEIEDAVRLLSSLQNPNSSSWNSIITGFVNRGRAREALDFLKKMHTEGVDMDQFTFSSVLSGVASLAALSWGVVIHCCTIRYGLDMSVVIGTALIDMYSKCGQVNNSESVFKSLPRKNLISWNALIQGFARNGDFNKVVYYYNELQSASNIKPDSVTFLIIISACSHSETPLEVAFRFLKSMVDDYGIEPGPEHCCSVIRLMGKKREVWRAKGMIDEMGFSCCMDVWRALLGACESCADLGVAEMAASKLMELGGDIDYVYVTMSNVYACHGRWKEASEMRKMMGLKGITKGAGLSWIEVDYASSSRRMSSE